MFNTLSTLLTRWLTPNSPATGIGEGAARGDKPAKGEGAPSDAKAELLRSEESHAAQLVPYDENLLERARTQWQFGDWQSLAQIERDTLQHHPDRAKLALLAAAGRLQTDQTEEAQQYIRLAQDWGVSKKLLTRILAAGVHNSLGRAAAIAGEQPRALQHFHSAIATGSTGCEARLLAQARISYQYQQLGLPPAPIGTQSNSVPPASTFLTKHSQWPYSQ